ncbi:MULTISPECIES: hypothetical protein [Cohnella]|uniref:hypothetical protein n=1 Tax=Cohnella TaxID=329857 RepID=UPI000E3887A2|nr:hypothetical protein [Cohnella sp.]REK65014.1 MAG: hypothetical protein C6P35_11645 [Cohnella sp.]
MYRKTVKVFLLMMLAFLVAVQPLSAATKTVKVKVTLVSVELVENHHVGNEWLTKGYVNGKEITEGSTVTLNLKPTDRIRLKAYAEEQDKIPESGTANATVKVSSIKSTINKSLKVTVVENRGRYSGNTAEWKFVYKIAK